MRYCLDSWAVMALLNGDEPAAARVDHILRDRPVMSWINLGEVFYVTHREHGAAAAREIVRELRPRLELDAPSGERVLEAAMIKARHPVAYADAFAVATALAHGATLVTGDPEILGADASWPTENLRS